MVKWNSVTTGDTTSSNVDAWIIWKLSTNVTVNVDVSMKVRMTLTNAAANVSDSLVPSVAAQAAYWYQVNPMAFIVTYARIAISWQDTCTLPVRSSMIAMITS